MYDIGNLMRQLPRTTASPRFTADVVRSLHQERPPRLWLRLAVSFATIVLVVGLCAASLYRYRHTRLDALRAEHQRIESDLRQVKASAASIKPLVVLENDDTRVIVAPGQQSTPIYY